MQFNSRIDWLKHRKKGIGGSDAAALWGAHQHLTELKLYEEKIAPVEEEKSVNTYITDLGHEKEIRARQKMAALYNMENFTDETFDALCVIYAPATFILGSLDGITKDMRTIAEYKFMAEPLAHDRDPRKPLPPGYLKHIAVQNISLPIRGGRVPDDFWIQCQHNMLASGAEQCMFGSLCGDELHECRIFPDLDFMAEHLEKCADFWYKVTNRIPPHAVDDDFTNIRVKGATALAREFRETRSKEIEKEIFALCTKPRMKIDGMKIILNNGKYEWLP